MQHLSLNGSSINLKSSLSSGRSSVKASDKHILQTIKSLRERPNITHNSNATSGLRDRSPRQSDVNRLRLNLEDSEDSECPVLHRATGPGGDEKPSPTDVARTKRNVSDWLKTYVDQSPSTWEQIDLESVGSSFARSPAKSRKPVDPELRVLLDSLDISQEWAQPTVENCNVDDQMTRLGYEPGLTESSDVADEPPPCHTRPVSDSLASGRNQENVEVEALPQISKHNLLEQNNAARTIQLFWHRHKRRKLAAQAALRRIMTEQKRRLDDQTRAQGMPLQAVQARLKQSSEKRVLKEHREKIKALNEKRAQKSNLQVDEQSSTRTKSKKTLRAKQADNEILLKPTTPMITPRHNRMSEGSSASVLSQEVPEREATSVASDEITIAGDDTERALEESNTELNDAKDCGHSTVDDIIHDIGRLSSLGAAESNGSEDTNDFLSKTCEPTLDVASGQDERPKGWSEMLTEIHRVLSEPDQPETLVYLNEKRPLRSASELIDPTSSLLWQIPGRPATVDSRSRTADLSKPRLLTRKNLQEHTRRLKLSAHHQRCAAQQELEHSVDFARSHLGHIMLNNNADLTQTVQMDPAVRKSSTLTHAACNRVSSAPLNCSLSFHDPVMRQRTLGQSCNGIQSQHFQANPVQISQMQMDDDLEVGSLRMQLEEQVRAVQRLQRTVDQQRELSSRQLRDTQREAEQRLESVKADYEATLSRNYKLIDELIEEKKALLAKCENLMAEMKTMAQKAEDKLKVVEDRHKVDLRKTEAKFAAAEKLRREKWEAEKTKQMKEMTVRGMESELAQLIATHQAEMRQLRQSCAEQVQAADVRAYQAYTGHIEEMRQTLTREKEEACAKEREAANQRLEKTLQDERAALDQQRRRLLNEAAEERERLALTSAREREEIERNRQNLESRLEQLTVKYERELVQQREEMTKRHEKEMDDLQQRDRAEREAWEEHTKSVLETQYAARENSLRDQLKRDRDRQLEAAVQRLEAESNQAREEVEREAETKIKRIREKLGAEIAELERSERQAMEKYCEMKTKLLDKEQESDRLRMQLQQKEQEMLEIRSLYEKLNQERQNLSDVVRQEFADRLVGLEEENRTAKRELAESKARLSKEQERHEADLEAIKRSNATELAEVHQRIKEAIKRRDEKTNAMRKTYEEALAKRASDVEEANRRANHLEELLDQQRQQFLKAAR